MKRCFVLHDVSSQPQNSSRQRREDIMNEGLDDDATHDYSYNDDGDMHQTQVPETQEDEEVYRVSVNDDTHPSNEFVPNTFRVPTRRNEQQNRVNSQSTVRRGNSSHRSSGSSATNVGSGSRENRRRQSFETTIQDTISGYREFQRQSLQQLRPGNFDQEDYDEFKKAEAIFLALQLPKKTKFYWACIDTLKELRFWRRYFIDIAGGTDEDKIELLEAMTSVSRNDQDLPRRLGSGHSYGGSHSTNPNYQQWSSPPNAPQWGTPNAPQWGTPPNAPHYGTPPNAPQYGTPPNAPQWSTPPNAPQ
ncbi:uncharacterized protein LOC9327289 [Arabidopsis lyrata subsp. lyrata]|uniref:uncharacterized protein LOC9327289 n=1 Tax=Arabidopsis lyrata subsp. lyrata TaxID=81972 RepID=UPI000A29E9CC|nr:uncharacterized protein LOC9327289 [Arabidopsis lyrata subsp. lyrata]XP_020870381.1 uncharacterized protein LOC9327289 [Arabidopsis lyrata subsp. lyrata]|eukprot:XP_002891227.2 uncharacterized protein LOC9327289 [Arabidopsis lyrata subsp. lyrata]